MNTARKPITADVTTQYRAPEGCRPPVLLLCLLALAVAVKPLAYAVAGYACCDRHKKTNYEFQRIHLLPVARLEKGSDSIVPYSDNMHKHIQMIGLEIERKIQAGGRRFPLRPVFFTLLIPE